MPDPLPEELAAGLRPNAGRRGPFGESISFFAETGSTNDIAAGMAEQGAPEGATVVALAQTAGRGRLGRDWFSPAGSGLYVSVVCRDRRALPFVSLAGGVAVASGIRRATGLPVFIKWPNDVVVPDRFAPGRRRKISGVLAEASSGSEGLQYAVLGFGVNLRPAAYPATIAGIATSIETELGREVDAGLVLSAILEALNDQMVALKAGHSAAVLEQWRALSPSAVGARVEWTADGRTRRGTTAGIDDGGALLLRTPDGLTRLIAGEVRWR